MKKREDKAEKAFCFVLFDENQKSKTEGRDIKYDRQK